MKVVTQWKAFTYSARVKRSVLVDMTEISLIQQVDAPVTPDAAREAQAKRLWEKMQTLRSEINRLKEKFHVGGG